MSSGLVGNWGQVNIHLRNLQRAKVKEKPLMSIAQVIAAQIKKNIESQAIPMSPLSTDYLNRKVSEGYDERILIKTGEYINSIEVKNVQHTGDSYIVEVGVKDGTTESGLSLQELAHYLEYGTITMPGRYPFTITWEYMKNKLKQEIVQQIALEWKGKI